MGGLLNPLGPRLSSALIPMTHTAGLFRALKTSSQGWRPAGRSAWQTREGRGAVVYDGGLCVDARKMHLRIGGVIKEA